MHETLTRPAEPLSRMHFMSDPGEEHAEILLRIYDHPLEFTLDWVTTGSWSAVMNLANKHRDKLGWVSPTPSVGSADWEAQDSEAS